MKSKMNVFFLILVLFLVTSCNQKKKDIDSAAQPIQKKDLTAQDILGNPDYLSISYGGYREKTRDIQPTIEQLKEDMKILYAMNVKMLRTYNVQLPQAYNILKAIHELKQADPNFEMYVMLGVWIECKNAWTEQPLHDEESEKNPDNIKRAVDLANQYPDIVKVIAVGNEAMVKWAATYFVHPRIILKWVNHLQNLKKKDELPKEIWVTSSDNFASWGGGSNEYHIKELEALIQSVDFISMHTYPMHETHYNPNFWGVFDDESKLSNLEKIDMAMNRAVAYATAQYLSVANFINSLGIKKPIHIGETGWASISNGFYGPKGTKATDEYKQYLYYKYMREWTNKEKIACFFFEAFDEPWKDDQNANGSENHFGLFTVEGQAKYAIWDLVEKGTFKKLTRDRNPITKTYDGNKDNLLIDVLLPPTKINNK